MKTWAPAALSLLLAGTTSCTGDLDSEPISPKIDTEYSNDGLFNKCYAVFAMAGEGYGDNGDAGSDVKGYKDEGMTNLYRLMWNANELTTDEAICGWGDNGLDQLVVNTYDDSNQMMKAYFARLTLGISATSILPLLVMLTRQRQLRYASCAQCTILYLWTPSEMCLSLRHSPSLYAIQGQRCTTGS